jgi:hypothetical protein
MMQLWLLEGGPNGTGGTQPDIPGFQPLGNADPDPAVNFGASAYQETSTGRVFFLQLPFNPGNSGSYAAINQALSSQLAEGVSDSIAFVDETLGSLNEYSGVVNIGWSLSGVYSVADTVDEFRNFSSTLNASNVQTVTFGSIPQISQVSALMNAYNAPMSVLSEVSQVTYNYSFTNDLADNAVTGFELQNFNFGPYLVGHNVSLGTWDDDDQLENPRFPASHMIESYEDAAPDTPF